MTHELSKTTKGVCSKKINALTGDPDFDCACPTGYSGKTCENDECTSNPCENER